LRDNEVDKIMAFDFIGASGINVT